MAAPQQQPAEQKQPAPPIVFKDDKIRLFLYVTGEKETQPALDYLMRYAKAPNVRRTAEIPLDRLTDKHVIIPIVRNINEDRRGYVNVEGTDRIRPIDYRAECVEGTPVVVADFYKANVTDDGFGGSIGEVDVLAIVNAVAAACVINGQATAQPRVQRRGDGQGNHQRWLVLQWG